VKKMDKVDGHDADDSERIKLEFLMDAVNSASKYSWKFAIFKDGCNFQRSGSNGWSSVRLKIWWPWMNFLTRAGCFGLCWRVKSCLILNIISGWGWRQKTQSSLTITLCLKIKDNKEEALTLFSGSENNNISNIKLTIPIHTALIFKEQANGNSQGTKIKRKGLRPTSLLDTTYWRISAALL
jgi:hypothetical protein